MNKLPSDMRLSSANVWINLAQLGVIVGATAGAATWATKMSASVDSLVTATESLQEHIWTVDEARADRNLMQAMNPSLALPEIEPLRRN